MSEGCYFSRWEAPLENVLFRTRSKENLQEWWQAFSSLFFKDGGYQKRQDIGSMQLVFELLSLSADSNSADRFGQEFDRMKKCTFLREN